MALSAFSSWVSSDVVCSRVVRVVTDGADVTAQVSALKGGHVPYEPAG